MACELRAANFRHGNIGKNDYVSMRQNSRGAAGNAVGGLAEFDN
jgi:hypothetical protein